MCLMPLSPALKNGKFMSCILNHKHTHTQSTLLLLTSLGGGPAVNTVMGTGVGAEAAALPARAATA